MLKDFYYIIIHLYWVFYVNIKRKCTVTYRYPVFWGGIVVKAKNV